MAKDESQVHIPLEKNLGKSGPSGKGEKVLPARDLALFDKHFGKMMVQNIHSKSIFYRLTMLKYFRIC